jgi:hypothetical protein
MPRDIGADQVKQHQQLLGRAVSQVNRVDGMALMLDESQTFFKRTAVRGRHRSDSTTA